MVLIFLLRYSSSLLRFAKSEKRNETFYADDKFLYPFQFRCDATFPATLCITILVRHLSVMGMKEHSPGDSIKNQPLTNAQTRVP